MPRVADPAAVVQAGLVPSQATGLVASTPSNPAPNPNAVIPGTDFTIIDRPKRKAVILVFGDAGVGKTSFALKYTPQPAVLIGFDGRSEYVEEAMKAAGRPIPAVQIAPPSVLQKSDNVRAAATEALRKFFRNYDGAIEASRTGRVRTIAIDTGSELGAIITLAVRGTLEQAKGDFGRSKDQINQIWYKVFGAARHTGNAHLVVLARASSIWENNEPTGDFRPKIADEAREAVDFSLHMRLGAGPSMLEIGAAAAGVTGVAGAGGSGLVAAGGGTSASGLVALPGFGGAGGSARPKEFELVVKKAGNTNPIKDLGLVFRESDWGDVGPFAYACTKLMPGSAPEDWR